jgi:hypothetical protein
MKISMVLELLQMVRHGKANSSALITHRAKKQRSYQKELLLLDWGYSLWYKRSGYHCKFDAPTFGPVSSLGVDRT